MLILFWIILIMATAIFVKRYLAYHNDYMSRFEQKRETPFEILKRRFAEGEISEDEYEARKKVLEKDENED